MREIPTTQRGPLLCENGRRRDGVDCTRISPVLARRPPSSCTADQFPEQMSQAECFCGAEKRMKVSGSQRAKLKSFHGLTKEVASTTFLQAGGFLLHHSLQTTFEGRSQHKWPETLISSGRTDRSSN